MSTFSMYLKVQEICEKEDISLGELAEWSGIKPGALKSLSVNDANLEKAIILAKTTRMSLNKFLEHDKSKYKKFDGDYVVPFGDRLNIMCLLYGVDKKKIRLATSPRNISTNTYIRLCQLFNIDYHMLLDDRLWTMKKAAPIQESEDKLC